MNTTFKVLAIDDNTDNLLSLKAVIQDVMKDVEVITATNGQSGLEMALSEQPDVILLDIVMPGIDGYEVCRQIKGMEGLEGIPVTFLTAWKTSPEARILALEAGAEGFLTKPFDEGELIAQIRSMFKISRANKREKLEKERLSEEIENSTTELRWQLSERRNAEEKLRITNERLVRSRQTMADLLEKLREENAARLESETHFRTLANNGRALIWTADECKLCDYFNLPWLEFTGRTIEQEMGNGWTEGVHPEDLEGCIETFSQSFDKKEQFNMTYRLRRNDGIYRWIIDEGAPRYDSTGEFIGYIGHCLDITEQIEAKEASRKSEEKFRLLVESAPVGIFVQVSEHFRFLNPEACRMFGASDQDELIDMPIFERFHVDYKDIMNKSIDILNREKRDVPYIEGVCFKLDGIALSVEVSAVPINFEGSDGALVFFLDISARKQAEELLDQEKRKLQQLTQMFNTLLDTIPDSILLVDEARGIEWLNTAARAKMGKDLSLDKGLKCHELINNCSDPCGNCPLNSNLASGQQYDRTITMTDGTILDVRAVPIDDGFGHFSKVIEICRDVTDIRRTEEQLRQAQKMESIGRLAGGVSHDFNNLLTVIIGNCEMALLDSDGQGPIKDYLEDIRKAGETAAGLTKQLLAFSRKQAMQPVPVNLNEIVEETRKMFIRLIKDNIEYEEILSPVIGNIEADIGQIEQVIINLVLNASEAMPDGGKLTLETYDEELGSDLVSRHVEIEAGHYVILVVSDTGVGMTEELKEHVFEPFFTTKDKGKGTGLGLSTVYGIVKQSKGNIVVYSEPGIGSSFKVYFKCIDKPAYRQETQESGTYEGTETILVVENDDEVRLTVSKALRLYGYNVLDAPDGQAALNVFMNCNQDIDLIVTDIVMPKMSGQDLADEVKRRFPEQKVLYMSGYTENTILHNGIPESCRYFIHKPFSLEQLGKKIRQVIGSKR